MGEIAVPLMWSALANAGAQGVQSMFQGADPAALAGYAPEGGAFLDPRRLMEQQVRDQAQVGAIQVGQAAQPVTLPGAFAQPSPYYTGGGLPIPIGVTAQDAALFSPGVHQMRAGAQFAQPDPGELARANDGLWRGLGEYTYLPPTGGEGGRAGVRRTGDEITGSSTAPATVGRWMFGEQAPRDDPKFSANVNPFDALSQPETSAQVQVGGGIPQLRANLELLGVTTNPQTGMFETQQGQAPTGPTANPQLFQGSLAWNPRGGVDQGAVQGSPFGGGPGLQANYQGQMRKAGVGV